MSPSRSRRTRKAAVDYNALSGQRKRRAVRSRAQGARSQPASTSQSSTGTYGYDSYSVSYLHTITDVEMDDGTRDPIRQCALDELAMQCSDNPQAVEYFRGHLLQEPPIPRGVFIFLTVSYLVFLIQTWFKLF